MTRNEGTVDRAVRGVVGLVLVLFSLFGSVGGAPAIILLVIGVVLLVTAAIGFCPLYKVLGNMNTLGRR